MRDAEDIEMIIVDVLKVAGCRDVEFRSQPEYHFSTGPMNRIVIWANCNGKKVGITIEKYYNPRLRDMVIIHEEVQD